MWNFNRQRVLLLPLFVLFLAACSTKPPAVVSYDVGPLWQQRLAQLERLESWSFDGRIAVRGGGKAWSARLSWAQQGPSYDILISAPFGQGAARLTGAPGQALIDVSGQTPLVADDPGTLLFEQLGWRVPVDALHYWLVGRPDPQSAAALEWDGQGRVVQLDQAGWMVTYRRYSKGARSVEEGISLPTKIELVNRDLRVKIVVDQWHSTNS